MREGFIFYRGFADALNDLEPEDRLACYDAICQYALDGTVPELTGVPSAIFKMARPQIDANNQKYENGKKGGRPKTEPEPNDNQTVTKAKPNDNQTVTEPEPKEKDKDKDKEKVKEKTPKGVQKKSSRFSPPTKDQVEAYIREKGYSVDAERFVDFYASKDWMVGKNKMKDWQAAVRNWARDRKEERPPNREAPKNRFNNFDQRTHESDYWTNLERTLLQKSGGLA